MISWGGGEAEEFFRSCSCFASDFFEGLTPQRGDLFCHDSSISGFAALATMRFGREVRAIGFEEIRVGGDLPNRFMEIAGIFKSGNSSKGNEMPKREEFFGLGGSTREAVKDCPKPTCVGLESREGVCPGVALVDDNVEGELNSEIELFLKENCLAFFKGRVLTEERLGAGGSASSGDGSCCKSALFRAG